MVVLYCIIQNFRERAAEPTRSGPHLYFAYIASTGGTGYFQCHATLTGRATTAHNESTGSSHWAYGVNTSQTDDTFAQSVKHI